MAIQVVNQSLSFWDKKSQGKAKSASGSFGDELSATLGRSGEKDGAGIASGKESAPENKRLSAEEIMQMIQNRKSEILEKVKKGETEPVIQIGGQAYTEKQWKRMLESFDDSEKDIKDMIREAIEKYKKEQAEQTEEA